MRTKIAVQELGGVLNYNFAESFYCTWSSVARKYEPTKREELHIKISL